MGKKKNKKKVQTRADTEQTKIWLKQLDKIGNGFTTLSNVPEIQLCARVIADHVANTTIHLMQNAENGDMRLNNGLSRKVDIDPSSMMNRHSFYWLITYNMIMRGNSLVIPVWKSRNKDYPDSSAWLDEMILPDMNDVSYIGDTLTSYHVEVAANNRYSHDEVLNFVYNPKPTEPYKGLGISVDASQVAKLLSQANSTVTDFMQNKMMPSLIIRVDSMTEELTTKEGKQSVYEDFVTASKAGEPWIVPMDLFDIREVKPLTLSDIAINETLTITKQSAAAIMGVPAFLLGIGSYNQGEYNNFIRTTVRTIQNIIAQTLTKGLLIAPDLYFRFNPRSLYAYDVKDLADVGSALYTRGLMTGNEVRDWLNLSPVEGLDELIMLENYIPADKIGQQSKLLNGGDEGES